MDAFWKEEAKLIDFIKPYDTVWVPPSGNHDEFVGTWFIGGKLNVADQCTTRFAKNYPEKEALIFVSETNEITAFTYQKLTEKVNQTANLLRSLGVQKGDRVSIWLPMVPELVFAQLACAKIGAIHSVIFSGFSPEKVVECIHDSNSVLLITETSALRRGKKIPLYPSFLPFKNQCPTLKKTLILQKSSKDILSLGENELSFEQEVAKQPTTCQSEEVDSEHPLFILYTSGTTGTPKGIVHSSAGYLIYVLSTLKYAWTLEGLLQNPDSQDVWFCTADIGWITGHSYLTYGPLATGAKVIMFEGVPDYPHLGRFWEIIDHFKVTHFYTSPTALRMLAAKDNGVASQYSLKSLKILGTVGEPIDPTTWHWYHETIGKNRCPIIDTYWQTETGGNILCPQPHFTLKPGSCQRPLPTIEPIIVKSDNEPVKEPREKGFLCIAKPWPGMMRTIWNDHARFLKTYLTPHPGSYYTGDEAFFDKDMDIWIVGRADDIIKVSGHRLGTAELESVISSHNAIAESAVVAIDDPIKGHSIVVTAVLNPNFHPSQELKDSIIHHVCEHFSAIAKPKQVIFVSHLPKTRSGKIIRRLIRNILTKEPLGDTSSLDNKEALESLKEEL
jgi:acetyl-CoA synthetase